MASPISRVRRNISADFLRLEFLGFFSGVGFCNPSIQQACWVVFGGGFKGAGDNRIAGGV